MSKPVVFLFSGQGSQSFHMGRELAEHCAPFRERLAGLDRIASAVLGRSVLDIVFDSARQRFDPFDRLLYSNPALFMLQLALVDTLVAAGARPALLMGASLGELVALTVAGAMTPDQALRLVIAMSQALERHAPSGGLVAVLAEPSIMQARPDLFDGVEIAGIGSRQHFIAAGSTDRVARIERVLGAEGTACLVLPVRHAFHSSHMEQAAPMLRSLFAGRITGPPAIPVVSCVTAREIDAVPHDHLWQVVRAPMRMADAFQSLEARQDSLFIDLGPSGTMATIAKYNRGPASRSEMLSVMSLFGNERAGFEAIRRRLEI